MLHFFISEATYFNTAEWFDFAADFFALDV